MTCLPLKVDELIGSPMSYELSLAINDNRHKGLPLKSSLFDSNEQVHSESDEDLNEYVALLSKNYSRIMMKFRKLAGRNAFNDVRDNHLQHTSQKGCNTQRAKRNNDRSKYYIGNRGNGIQCHECEGFGHIQKECPTFLRKQKNGYVATFSDYWDDNESEHVSNFVAFISSITNPLHVLIDSQAADDTIITDEDDLSYVTLNDTYNIHHTKWVEES